MGIVKKAIGMSDACEGERKRDTYCLQSYKIYASPDPTSSSQGQS